MPKNNSGPVADGLTGEFDVGTSVSTYSLTNPAGQRLNVHAENAPVALTTDGTAPVVGGAGTQVPVVGGAGSGHVIVTLPANATLKVIGQRAGRVWLSRAA
jgi:hypothetical protein